ncbi:unnamed protein product [Amaranthus hypochondriacus]
MVKGDVESGQRDFYGLLEKVIVLEYDSLKDRTSPRVVLFRCKWFDVFDDRRGIHKDKFGATLVNITRKLRTNEPFALVSQIEQVFYVPTHNEAQWRIVIKTKPRKYFDFPNDENDNDDESLWEQVEVENVNVVNEDDQIDDDNYPIRNDVVPNLVDIRTLELNAIDDDFDVDIDVDEETDDESNGNDEEEFSDRESSVCSLDRDLENIGLDSDSDSSVGYYKRGPSRGLNSRRWREKHPTEKPSVKISDAMRRVTGDKAAEFISDCSRWVREYCTLKAR